MKYEVVISTWADERVELVVEATSVFGAIDAAAKNISKADEAELIKATPIYTAENLERIMQSKNRKEK